MSKLKLFSAVFLLVGLGFAALQWSSCSAVQAATCLHPTLERTAHSATQLAPRYYEYSPEVLAWAHTQGKVVLYFWAPWCSTCTSLDFELQDQKAVIPEGVVVLRLNYDQATELRQKYHVVTQHTFVQLDEKNQPLATWVGGELDNFGKYLK